MAGSWAGSLGRAGGDTGDMRAGRTWSSMDPRALECTEVQINSRGALCQGVKLSSGRGLKGKECKNPKTKPKQNQTKQTRKEEEGKGQVSCWRHRCEGLAAG